METPTTAKRPSTTSRLDLVTWAAFITFAVSAVIVAISLPEISHTFSTNLSEGGRLESVRSLLLIVTLLLSGLLAARWGKKRFLALGQLLVAAGLLLASLAPSYAVLLPAVIIMGAGGGLMEGLINPLIIDTHPHQSGRYLNLGHAMYPLGILTSSLLFGELLTLGFSWRFLFQLAGAAALVVSVLFFLLPFPPEVKDETSSARSYGSILKVGGFWLFAAAIALGASIESAFTFWSRSYVGVYLSDVPRAGAIAVAVFAAAMFGGRLLFARLAHRDNLNTLLIGAAVLGLVVSALLPFATSLLPFYLLLALAGLAVAGFWPTLMAEASQKLNADTTLLLVMLAVAGVAGFGITPWLLGLIGDSSGLRAGFVFIPALFAALIVALLVERRIRRPKRRSADL